MGRPREFDEDDVIDGAVQAFWKQGYGSTSIPDLLSATELERGSLYKAFGDKHTLFERALERYLSAGRTALKDTLASEEGPLRGIERWLTQIHAGCSGSQGASGCLAVNAMVELAPTDTAVRKRLERHWRLVARRLEMSLLRAQITGEVRDDMPARRLAEWIIRLVAGIAVFARQGDRTDISPAVLAMLRS